MFNFMEVNDWNNEHKKWRFNKLFWSKILLVFTIIMIALEIQSTMTWQSETLLVITNFTFEFIFTLNQVNVIKFLKVGQQILIYYIAFTDLWCMQKF